MAQKRRFSAGENADGKMDSPQRQNRAPKRESALPPGTTANPKNSDIGAGEAENSTVPNRPGGMAHEGGGQDIPTEKNNIEHLNRNS